MSNDYFQFRQFRVRQQRCAMKVGTDGTLLGAWAQMPMARGRILDIGTGTGLIALMMAQRFPDASVVGIDIDSEAVAQAQENVEESPFAQRITIRQADVLQFDDEGKFDAIVCNPPYFVNALTCPDQQRTTARHTVSLSYEGLMQRVARLLTTEGLFSVVIPVDSRSALETAAYLNGLFLSRVCMVKTTPRKAPKRCMIEFVKHIKNEIDIEDGIIEEAPCVRSDWYQRLTAEFYL